MGADNHASRNGPECNGARGTNTSRSAGHNAGRKHSGTRGAGTGTSRNASSDAGTGRNDAGTSCGASRCSDSRSATDVVRGANRFRR